MADSRTSSESLTESTQAQAWCRAASAAIRQQLETLTDSELAEPSLLPEWSRGHVISHLIANALALRRLTEGGLAGTDVPMYAANDVRLAEIVEGATQAHAIVMARFGRADASLSEIWASVPQVALGIDVRSRMGRRVPLSELPWLRAREMWIHAVDLDGSITWADVPRDVLTRVVRDSSVLRSARNDGPALSVRSLDSDCDTDIRGSGSTTVVEGTCADLASYLTGRGPRSTHTLRGQAPPELPPWL